LHGGEGEDEEVGAALPAQPAVILPREAATLGIRFMAENASKFVKDVELNFQRKIAAPINKMVIGRLRSRVLCIAFPLAF
jgi:hypothetical protein